MIQLAVLGQTFGLLSGVRGTSFWPWELCTQQQDRSPVILRWFLPSTGQLSRYV